MHSILSLLRQTNERLAVAAGGLLLLSVCVTLFDVVARPLGMSLGGTDELSGYAMAIATGWGVSYALTMQAHVRIDLLRARGGPRVQGWFDIVAILSVAAVSLTIAYRAWPVLGKTIKSGATANTTLETPLWIPQSLWLVGWVWFAASAVLLSLGALWFLATSQHSNIDNFVGLRGEDE
ncbi:TRAP transporter small permease [Epibacterium ulvae]|uniref:TRAP transporter small permease subunit n=1 Tax=Epibacterium ulvae TaxID=1156985 RepID=UPI001BFC97E9|nr:TRAP transporter small permease [Epibacterium ulvae]MBT8153419.1 TRAP transporter small permease [Epibacterium ulvae]